MAQGSNTRGRRTLVAAAATTMLSLALVAPAGSTEPTPREEVAGSIIELQVTGFGGVPNDAEAVVLNVTAVNTARPGFFTVFPCDEVPGTSNVNYVAGDLISNAVIAEVGAFGSVCIFTYAGADLIVDLAGWFPAGSDYTSVSPERLVDTRPSVKLENGDELVVPVVGRAGIPPGAAAVSVNLTATESFGDGFLTAYPCGQPAPLASNVNYVTLQTVPNLAVVKVGAGGAICIAAFTTVDVLVDVFGWFAPGGFTPLTPTRLVDTRNSARVPANSVLPVPVPAGVNAAVVNVTATGPLSSGFLTVFPCGSPVPLASNVNYVAGQTAPNLAVGKVGTGGSICIYTLSNTDIVVDLFGTFAPGASFTPISPVRVYDSRQLGPPILDAFGLGPLFLGMSPAEAFASGAVDPPASPACPFDPGATSARLAPPLVGSVQFRGGEIETIVVDFGAVLPGGEGPGSDVVDLIDALESLGYTTEFDPDFVDVFGVELLEVFDGPDVVFEAIVDPDDGVVLRIASPFVPVCD